MDYANCPGDTSFGPIVDSCRDGFDFTLKFELIFFAIVPSSIFLILTVPRAMLLYHKPIIIARRSKLYVSKQLLIFFNLALRITLLVLSAQRTVPHRLSNLFVSAQGLGTSVASVLPIISHYEHSRYQRPSAILNVYLGITLLLDIAHDRTLWLSAFSSLDFVFVRLFTIALACKVVLAVLESYSKKSSIVGRDRTKQSLDGTKGIYSLGTFDWLSALFFSGYKRVLRLDELPVLDEYLAVDVLRSRFLKNVKRHPREPMERNYNKSLRLVHVLGHTLWIPLLLPVIPRLALIGFNVSQAFLIQAVLDFLRSDETSEWVGYGLIGATVLIYAGITFSTSLYWYYHQRMLYMARACLASSIFQKTTELSVATLAESQAVTLMSTDIERVLTGFLNLHELWASLLQAALVSWILWIRLRLFFLVPISLTLVCFIALAIVGRYIGPFQKAWMQETQRRVSMIANVIANMKQVKISGLATAIEKKVQGARITELRASRGVRLLQIAAMILSLTPELIAPVITLAAKSGSLATSSVFTVIALLSLLTAPLGQLFQSVSPLMSALACLHRIQTYLGLPPIGETRIFDEKQLGDIMRTPASSDKIASIALRVVNGNFRWQEDGAYCLRGINMTVEYSALTMVVGPVGSGKSTLCKALIGELALSNGQIFVGEQGEGRIAYCDQTPFLLNGTIRENIVSFSQWDPCRYDDVVEASALSYDMAELPHGHDTLIGTNGFMLSGGQKQRIAIARALYLDAHVLLFDDVLSGLDARTEAHVFHHVFGPQGLLKRRCDGPAVVLCTHSVMYLPSADHIVALSEQGEVTEQGKWEVLIHNQGYVQSLGLRETETVTLELDLHMEEADGRNLLHDTKGDRVQETITSEQQVAGCREGHATHDGPASANSAHDDSRFGSLANYRHYFKAVSIAALVAFFASALCYGFFFAFPNIWLSFWLKDAASTHPNHPESFWVGIYGLFHAMSLLGGLSTMYLALTHISLVSGASLHLSLLHALMKAPLSLFQTSDQGTLTNYFSQDITLVDGELPRSLIQFACDMAITLSMAGVLASSSPYLATVYPIVIALMYATATLYLRTSRQLRVLTLEVNSPMYMHFLDVGRGIATIRAAKLLQHYKLQNNQLLELSQRPAYLLAMVQYWLLFVLNIIVMSLAILAVTFVTQLKGHGTAFAGSGLIMLLQLGQIMATAIQAYAKLETSMGAVHRLRAFCGLVGSRPDEEESVIPPVSWPSQGHIRLKGVSASYSTATNRILDTQDSLALKDLQLDVKPGQRVAICGRSGSGKSSLILLLLRLLDPLPNTSLNSITIDGIHLRTIDRTVLPKRIITVPQEAIFLPTGSSWQENLDFHGTCNEGECQSILKDVGLWPLVNRRGGTLTTAMNCDELSQGQKQLFSLARAALRKLVKDRETQQAKRTKGLSVTQPNRGSHVRRCDQEESERTAIAKQQMDVYCLSELKPSDDMDLVAGQTDAPGGILLLDEVNSSMDLRTEQQYFDFIQHMFVGYTVIMITHSLTTFIRNHRGNKEKEKTHGSGSFFDRVIVLESGAIVEDGHPTTLLKTSSSRFRSLCEAAAGGDQDTDDIGVV